MVSYFTCCTVSKYNKNIRFVWLPSHIGIKENELADKSANSAAANSHYY